MLNRAQLFNEQSRKAASQGRECRFLCDQLPFAEGMLGISIILFLLKGLVLCFLFKEDTVRHFAPAALPIAGACRGGRCMGRFSTMRCRFPFAKPFRNPQFSKVHRQLVSAITVASRLQ